MKKKKVDLKKMLMKHWKFIGITSILLAAIFILFIWDGGEDTPYTKTTTTTTLYECGEYCQTSGEWNASQTIHDTGRLASDGSWMSVKDGFGYLVGSIYIPLKKGSYEVTYEMKVDDNTGEENVCYIEAAHDYGIPIIGRYVKANEFNEPNVYQDFTLRLNTPNDLFTTDFRVHYDHANQTVNVRKITLNKVY